MEQSQIAEPIATSSAGAAGMKPMDIMRIVRSAGGALLAQAALHGQLARVEWEEEKNRLLGMLIVTLAGFSCLLCLMLFGSAFILAISWETGYRIPVVLILLAVYTLGIILAGLRFRTLAAQGEQTFAATREEIAVDIALIRSKL